MKKENTWGGETEAPCPFSLFLFSMPLSPFKRATFITISYSKRIYHTHSNYIHPSSLYDGHLGMSPLPPLLGALLGFRTSTTTILKSTCLMMRLLLQLGQSQWTPSHFYYCHHTPYYSSSQAMMSTNVEVGGLVENGFLEGSGTSQAIPH